MNTKPIICFLLAVLVLQLQISGIAVCAQEISQAAPAASIMITPLHGGVEVITKNGARIVRKVRRVRYYRRSNSGTRSVRRYHVVRHSQQPAVSRTRVGDKIITKAAPSGTATTQPASFELPRDIVEPLIIRGMDNLKAGKRYVELVERDGKLFIKESGEIDPNGQFVEVEEENGIWKIKGTDIVVDYTRTFDVSKVPPAVKAYLKPSTDYIAPDETYVHYKEGASEPIPILESTIPALVNPGDYVELHQVSADGDFAPGSWETIDIPVGSIKGSEGTGDSLVPVSGSGTGAGYSTSSVETGGPGVGSPGVPLTVGPVGGSSGPIGGSGGPIDGPGGPIGGPGGPGGPVAGPETEGPGRNFPIGISRGGVPGIPTTGVPETSTPAGGIVPPGAPMKAAADELAPLPAAATETPKPEEAPKAMLPPVIPGSEETTPPAAGILPPGYPMSEGPGRVVPVTDIGNVPPPGSGSGPRYRGGGRGFGLPPLGGVLPAVLGTAAVGGMVALPFMLGRNGGNSGGSPGFVPFPAGSAGQPMVTGSSPGVTGYPQVSPTSSIPPSYSPTTHMPGAGTPPVCTTPTTTPPCTTPPYTPPCTTPPVCSTPPPCQPPPCGPPPPTCGPPPPYCGPPPSCPPPPCVGGYNPGCIGGPICGPVMPGCPPPYPACPPGGYGGGYGCDTGYGGGYGGGYGCDTGYGGGLGSGMGCDNGYGGYGGGFGGNPCMTNASKFGCSGGSGGSSFKEKWWSEHGRDYCYDDPCAAQQAACAGSMGGGLGSGMGSGMGSPTACPPVPCEPPPVCAPY